MTRKTGFAAALVYDPRFMSAPAVVASGSADLADEILRMARKKGIPIEIQSSLAKHLSVQPLDAPIPEELYEEVAAILAEYQEIS